MWHATNIDLKTGIPHTYVKCMGSNVHPPTHRCVFCEMEDEIDRLNAEVSRLCGLLDSAGILDAVEI